MEKEMDYIQTNYKKKIWFNHQTEQVNNFIVDVHFTFFSIWKIKEKIEFLVNLVILTTYTIMTIFCFEPKKKKYICQKKKKIPRLLTNGAACNLCLFMRWGLYCKYIA